MGWEVAESIVLATLGIPKSHTDGKRWIMRRFLSYAKELELYPYYYRSFWNAFFKKDKRNRISFINLTPAISLEDE